MSRPGFPRACLTPAQVRMILAALRAGVRVCDLAREHAVSTTAISRIGLGHTWKRVQREMAAS